MRYVLLLLFSVSLLFPAADCAAQTEWVLARPDPGSNVTYSNPNWSPDGRSIAYVTNNPLQRGDEPVLQGDTRIRVATLRDGRWRHRSLTQGDYPVWSPDGRRLAFRRGGISVMDMRAGRWRRSVRDGGRRDDPSSRMLYPLSWSPGGRYLLYGTAYYEGSDGSLVDSRTSRVLRTRVGDESVWLRDGRLVTIIPRDRYYRESSRLVIINPRTGSSRAVLRSRRLERPFVPRGERYAWVLIRNDPGRPAGIYRIDLRTGGLVRVLRADIDELYWSPDGRRFAFTRRETFGGVRRGVLYLGDTRTWQFSRVRTGVLVSSNWHNRLRHAAWSRDGRRLAYVTENGEIRILVLSG